MQNRYYKAVGIVGFIIYLILGIILILITKPGSDALLFAGIAIIVFAIIQLIVCLTIKNFNKLFGVILCIVNLVAAFLVGIYFNNDSVIIEDTNKQIKKLREEVKELKDKK